MKFSCTLLLSALLFVEAGHAAAPDQPASQPRERKLTAQIVLVDSDTEWRKRWNTVSDGPVVMGFVKETMERGKKAYVMVLFSGCVPGADGNCDLSFTAEVKSPHGKPMILSRAFRQPPATKGLQLWGSSLFIEFDATDPLGEYSISLALADNNAGGAIATATQVLQLRAGEEAAAVGVVPPQF